EASQGLRIASELSRDYRVRVHDPLAMDTAKIVLGDSVEYAKTICDAITGADVVVLATPDSKFSSIGVADFTKAGPAPVLIDCWRILPASLHAHLRVVTPGRATETERLRPAPYLALNAERPLLG